ncbi:hypothetical protein KFE25_005571 [Diacronema lutheri]|uniref:Uncharacterized protein n=2 Tax=Diacronema lutheri TaxID=2081491 RepID=A0A8J5XC58_DIALT|nr:hypothetical protein KFE25_005571 [Diacronema lutheri]
MWPSPEDPLDDAGLGGGITYTIAPDFCTQLLGQFQEDDSADFSVFDFVTCADVNDAIARAMATWSANHPYINFYNVTDECAAEGRTVTCTLAELYIGAKSPDVGDEEVAAFVLHNPDDVRTYSTQWKTGVRAPSGEVIGNDWQIKFATLTFHNHICWYLDNTFCAQFRLLNESIDATLLMQFIVWGVWSVSFLTLFMRVAQIFFYVFRFGYKVGLRRAVQAQARDMLYTYVLVFFLISPPIIWFKIFIPCLTCYDFEATAAHELGHVLGFTHTDSFPENNRVETERFSADVCAYSQGVPDKSGSVVGIDAEFAGIEDSIMFHLTTKKSKACLSQNDFQGLLFHYPVCAADSIRESNEPLCVKSQRNIGWVRFVTATVPPFVIASICVFCLVHLALYYENKEQTRNRWKLGGLSAVQESRRRRQTEEEDFARGIFNKSISRGLSRAGTIGRRMSNASSKRDEADAAAANARQKGLAGNAMLSPPLAEI